MTSAELGSRALFPALTSRAYLNHAAMSPLSQPVQEAALRCMDGFAADGLLALYSGQDQRHRLKDKLAALIGANAEDIALVPSTTRGIVDIALCFPWNPGDRVVAFEGEFPTNVTPWQRVAELYHLDLVLLSAAEFRNDETKAFEHLAKELRAETRLVAVSAVEFQTGFTMPIREITALCHLSGTQVFVDAIQAVGVLPMNVKEWSIDYLACGSHKWLMAMDGVAFVYATPAQASKLRPNVAGWLSHEEATKFLLDGPGHLSYDRPVRKTIDFLESSSLSSVGCAALEASITLLLELSPKAIFEHVNRYLDVVETELVDSGFKSLRSSELRHRSAILSLLPPPQVDVIKLKKKLGSLKVACTTPDGYLRLSPHWPNSLNEVDYVVKSVQQSLSVKSSL